METERRGEYENHNIASFETIRQLVKSQRIIRDRLRKYDGEPHVERIRVGSREHKTFEDTNRQLFPIEDPESPFIENNMCTPTAKDARKEMFLSTYPRTLPSLAMISSNSSSSKSTPLGLPITTKSLSQQRMSPQVQPHNSLASLPKSSSYPHNSLVSMPKSSSHAHNSFASLPKSSSPFPESTSLAKTTLTHHVKSSRLRTTPSIVKSNSTASQQSLLFANLRAQRQSPFPPHERVQNWLACLPQTFLAPDTESEADDVSLDDIPSEGYSGSSEASQNEVHTGNARTLSDLLARIRARNTAIDQEAGSTDQRHQQDLDIVHNAVNDLIQKRSDFDVREETLNKKQKKVEDLLRSVSGKGKSKDKFSIICQSADKPALSQPKSIDSLSSELAAALEALQNVEKFLSNKEKRLNETWDLAKKMLNRRSDMVAWEERLRKNQEIVNKMIERKKTDENNTVAGNDGDDCEDDATKGKDACDYGDIRHGIGRVGLLGTE
ncbi:3292_t:CDS:2 [Paraglomus brasilianum]|uniref:3292_t:CDS:1 n=1 Tax=Paraglomus brasilianum TaxID=144538 RepID=A0A9N8WKP0_9GLOM|nr:3292_t:CDS:2 [Paraglomus brasilianum]